MDNIKVIFSLVLRPLLAVLWIISLVIPFFFLNFVWALIALLFVSVISPSILLLLSIGLELTIGKLAKNNYLEGLLEGFFFIFISQVIDTPNNFLLVIIILYTVNQINRIFKRTPKEELDILIGFIGAISISVLFKVLLFRF
jgi:hypothetical protein